jgi:hypothetical protein
MPIKNDKSRSWMLKLAALAMIFVVTHTVYAVDGIIIKSSKTSKSSFSNMKKTINISLNTGFSYRENKSFVYRKSDKVGNYNNVISFQKGNIKIMMPYRSKPILQKFKTPEKPQQ